jgi:hypothetical protein
VVPGADVKGTIRAQTFKSRRRPLGCFAIGRFSRASLTREEHRYHGRQYNNRQQPDVWMHPHSN